MRLLSAPLRLNSSVSSSLFFATSRAFTSSAVAFRYKPTTKRAAMAHETTNKVGKPLDRAGLDSLIRRTLFYTPAFEIYSGISGGTAGLFDYGPPGCGLENNIIDLWRKHFVQKEKMLELSTTILTPYDVFLTSGHVDKFTDWMCKDPKSGEYLRADHLVEDVLEARLKGDKMARGQKLEEKEEDEKRKKKKAKTIDAVKLDDATVQEYEEVLAKIDNYNGTELGELITKYQIKNPSTGGDVQSPISFNLMFSTAIGPSGLAPGYLRPETAQGQFLNFAKLLAYNNGKTPFASASIGKSFRNEISPRGSILRVREFLMAEIEHFVDPEGGKKHPKFEQVKHIQLKLLNRDVQLAGKTAVEETPIGKAVETGIVDNETIGYFMARVQLFLLKIGIDPNKLRFRQHMAQEMAHYAADCWDAELWCNNSWVECVGIADRSAYDLSVHMKKTKQPLVVREKRDQPLEIEEWEIEVNKKKLGPLFKRDAKTVETAIDSLTQDLREKLSLDLKNEGKIAIDVEGVGNGKVELNKDLITIEKRKRIEHTREYIPNVIEPSFGIGRIMYALLEHSYWTREGDEARGVLSFPSTVAPYKVLVAGLYTKPEFVKVVERVSSKLDDLDISHTVDNSSVSIGKRYARADEVGTVYAVTADHQSLEDSTFTVRERDTTKQIRVSEEDLYKTLSSLINGTETWDDVVKRFGLFESKDEEAPAS